VLIIIGVFIAIAAVMVSSSCGSFLGALAIGTMLAGVSLAI
jgi:hypothetical protein